MNAVERRARELLAEDDPHATWEDMLEVYSLWPNSVLVIQPTLVLAARPIFSSNGRGWAWYVHMLSGNLAEAWQHLPYELDSICWRRHSTRRLHFHPLKRIRALSHVRRIQTLH